MSCGSRSVFMSRTVALPPPALKSQSVIWCKQVRWSWESFRGTGRFSPESELGTHTIHSCPHQPGASLSPHSQWDMFQLANLTNCLLCPSLPLPSASVPYSALLNAFFYPSYFSRFLPWCVSCMSCGCSKAQISERYQARFHWAIKLNNGVCVLLSASAFNFFRVVGGEPVVRMEMTSINKVEKRSKSYYATCVCRCFISSNTVMLPEHISLHDDLSKK